MTKQELMMLDEEIVTLEVLESIEEMEEVVEVENNGASGQHYGYNWYTVKLENDEEVQVYVK